MLLLVAVPVVRAQALRTSTEACGAHLRAEQVVPERQLAPPFISSQTEMRRLESVVHTIHMELQNIRRKEERMRDVNGAQRCLLV